MKKISRFLLMTAVTIFFAQLMGCKKKPDVKPPTGAELCDIKHMKYFFAGSSPITDADFAYNAHGDPLSVTVSNPGTGNPNVIFLYDQYHRLTDYFEPYAKVDPANLPSDITFEVWYRYTYADQNPNSLPIADTSRVFGARINGQFKIVIPMEINHYTYDSQGRITQVKSTNTTFNYNYDANGNLMVVPNVTYDDKVNFTRTSKFWMFVDRNYSVNNPFIATAYNSNGLPTTIPNSRSTFMHRTSTLNSIDYSCDTKSYNY